MEDINGRKNILIKNCLITDLINRKQILSDVYIEEGLIKTINKKIDAFDPLFSGKNKSPGNYIIEKNIAVINADGLVVAPSFMDMHVHLRDPGNTDEEDIESAEKSAFRGGISSICSMPNTNPPVDSDYLVKYLKKRSELSGLRIYPAAAMTKGLAGNEMTEFSILKDSGALALSDDGNCVQDSKLMFEIMKYAKQVGLPLILHEEDYSFSKNGLVHEGFYSTKLGLNGIPALAEEIMIARDIMLSEKTGARIHITHVSSKGSIEMIKAAKEKGIKITCDITPHHLYFDDSCIEGYNTNYKVNPPIRSLEDRQALINGLKEGIIDAIASDHAPHLLEEKDTTFSEAAFGAIGMETLFSSSFTGLCIREGFNFIDFMELIAKNPYNLMDLKMPLIKKGEIADIVLLDTNREIVVDKKSFYSKSSNCPFNGMKLKGDVVCTVNRGRICFFNSHYK